MDQGLRLPVCHRHDSMVLTFFRISLPSTMVERFPFLRPLSQLPVLNIKDNATLFVLHSIPSPRTHSQTSLTLTKMSATTQTSSSTDVKSVTMDLKALRTHYARNICGISGHKNTNTSAAYLHYMACRLANSCEAHPSLSGTQFSSRARALERHISEACRTERNMRVIKETLSDGYFTACSDKATWDGLAECSRKIERSQEDKVEKRLVYKKLVLAGELWALSKQVNRYQRKLKSPSGLIRPREVIECGCDEKEEPR
ncbi:hypothetical protein DE146DRAFT_104346 [Phaeosphaeria sp. MPI-PUGE-AT-0046c]|nr:hypothetical protein DE146DRAFT_104346 [Phaeosphaeria sp. MPI-PUGE-AT-0046c]